LFDLEKNISTTLDNRDCAIMSKI